MPEAIKQINLYGEVEDILVLVSVAAHECCVDTRDMGFEIECEILADGQELPF